MKVGGVDKYLILLYLYIKINENQMEKRDIMIKSLTRINELAKKQREGVLTAAEKAEQQVLRTDYLREIRGQVLSTFSGLSIVDPDGNDVTPEKLRHEQKKLRE